MIRDMSRSMTGFRARGNGNVAGRQSSPGTRLWLTAEAELCGPWLQLDDVDIKPTTSINSHLLRFVSGSLFTRRRIHTASTCKYKASLFRPPDVFTNFTNCSQNCYRNRTSRTITKITTTHTTLNHQTSQLFTHTCYSLPPSTLIFAHPAEMEGSSSQLPASGSPSPANAAVAKQVKNQKRDKSRRSSKAQHSEYQCSTDTAQHCGVVSAFQP